MRLLQFFIITFLTASLSFAQDQKNLDIDYMLRGYFYAQSSIEDKNALGGFAGSSNSPKYLSEWSNLNQEGLFLYIDTLKSTTFAEKYNGYMLYLANKSDSMVRLDASDSRLYIVAEAFVKDEWQAIEYLPSSWCGNSYHQVYLKKGEYWNFKIPSYTGKIPTKLRYRLKLSNGEYIYSNTISAGINKKQLTEKQGHSPQSIMDPYDD